jgi:cell wall assembly regulator SMI1/predicted DNA-binding WGR domain protein
MRRFEFKSKKSNKFWQISRQGNAHTVSFGRIGAAGQQQTKTFSTPELAAHDEERLVHEKLAKGYREVTPGAAGKGASGSPKPAKLAKPGKATKVAAAFQRVEAALAATDPDALSSFLPPANSKTLAACERKLKFRLHPDLRELWSIHGGEVRDSAPLGNVSLVDCGSAPSLQKAIADSIHEAGLHPRCTALGKAWLAFAMKCSDKAELALAGNPDVDVLINCTTGHIFELADTCNKAPKRVARSLAEWLDSIARQITRAGKPKACSGPVTTPTWVKNDARKHTKAKAAKKAKTPAKAVKVANPRISAAIAKIKSWMSDNAPGLVDNLARPASSSQIDALGRKLELEVPSDLRDLWSIHNGQIDFDGPGFFAHDPFLATTMVETSLEHAKIAISALADKKDWKRAGVREEEIGPSQWVMFAGARDGFVANVKTGRVFECQRDWPPLTLAASSIAEWLEHYARDLKARKYEYDDDDGELRRRD